MFPFFVEVTTVFKTTIAVRHYSPLDSRSVSCDLLASFVLLLQLLPIAAHCWTENIKEFEK